MAFALTLGARLVAGSSAAADPYHPREMIDNAGVKLVLVPAGRFLMGAGDGQSEALRRQFWRSARLEEQDLQTEKPQHPVRISRAFYLSAHEITVGQFRRFVTATGYRTDAERSRRGARGFRRRGAADGKSGQFETGPQYSWRSPGFPQGEDHPVVDVSWNDAVAFSNWLGGVEKAFYRLPTEAEWEYACRAGTTTWLSFGDDPSVAHLYANLADVSLERAEPGHVARQRLVDVNKDPADGYAYTAPVGSFKPNAFGLFDMHGNVWEWCQDRYERAYYHTLDVKAASVDPTGPRREGRGHELRVLRGGSWYVDAITARSTSRLWNEPGDAFCYAGFRVVREP